MQLVINWSSLTSKKHKTLKILTKVEFLRIFLKYHIFRDFYNSSVARAKIVVCILFYLKKNDLTEYNLIRPFCDVKHFTAAVHFRFLRGRGFESHRRHCVVSLSKNINPSLVLVQPRKTRPFITERVLMGCKESNQKKTSGFIVKLKKSIKRHFAFFFNFQTRTVTSSSNE